MTGIYRVLLSIATLVMISTDIMATDGYFSHGIGTHYKMLAAQQVFLFLKHDMTWP